MALSSGAEVVWCIMMIVVTSDRGRLVVSLVSPAGSGGHTAWSCFLTLSSAMLSVVGVKV